MAIRLTIEFSMYVLAGYNGGLSNLDVTLDDNITYLLGRHFYDNGIRFSVISMDIVDPAPNQNDEMVRYEIEIEAQDAARCADFVMGELAAEGYERSCTIWDGNEVLHADVFTANIRLRRQLKRDAK